METTVRIKRKGDCLELDSTSSNSSHDENIGSTTALKTCILCDESTKATENDKPETLTEAFQDIDDEIRSFVDINPSAKLTEKLKNNISHFYHQSCMDDFQRCNSKTTNQCNLQPIPQKQTFQNATSKKIKLQLNAQDSSESDNSLLSNQSQTSILNNFNANSPSLRVKSEPCEERADTSIVSILSPLPEIKDCDDKPDLVKVEVCVEDNPLPVDEEILAKLSHIKPEDYGEEHHQDKGNELQTKWKHLNLEIAAQNNAKTDSIGNRVTLNNNEESSIKSYVEEDAPEYDCANSIRALRNRKNAVNQKEFDDRRFFLSLFRLFKNLNEDQKYLVRRQIMSVMRRVLMSAKLDTPVLSRSDTVRETEINCSSTNADTSNEDVL